jgi:hypothetical protein
MIGLVRPVHDLEPPMPRTPTPAQIEASRQNGRRSHGPITPAGKARSALNARSWGLRSVDCFVTEDEDVERFGQLQDAIHDQFRPASPLEAALCARMVTALWRSERAERLENDYWAVLPYGCPSTGMGRIDILNHDVGRHRPTLDTIMRYLSQAQNAYARAFRQLQSLREGRADPGEDELFVTSDLPDPLYDALEIQAGEGAAGEAPEPEAPSLPDDGPAPMASAPAHRPTEMPAPPADAAPPLPANDGAAEGPAPDAAGPAAPPPPLRPGTALHLSAAVRPSPANDALPQDLPEARRPTLSEICTNEPELAQQWLWKEVQAWMASR